MSGIRVVVEGIDRTREAFRRVSVEGERRARAVVQDTAARVRDGAQRRAPRLTGELASSITTELVDSKLRTVVGINPASPAKVYAPIIEFGWSAHGIEAQPFMRPAAEAERKQHDKAMKQAMAGLE